MTKDEIIKQFDEQFVATGIQQLTEFQEESLKSFIFSLVEQNDPYQSEINHDDTPVWECEECRYQSSMEI